METIALETFTDDWRAVVANVQRTGEPVELALDGVVCGMLLPSQDAQRISERYAASAAPAAANTASASREELRNYLELLRDDPALVPLVDGQPLEFITMMNSSFVDPQQIYQFRHPTTREMYIYRADELRQAIGRMFISVDFIPIRPKDFVDGKH